MAVSPPSVASRPSSTPMSSGAPVRATSGARTWAGPARGRQPHASVKCSAHVDKELYRQRNAIEETFQGSKSHLGFEQPQGWSRQAVRRTAPVVMFLYSLTVLCFAREGHALYKPPSRPWYRHKVRPSFADMLATLRHACLRQGGLRPQPIRRSVKTSWSCCRIRCARSPLDRSKLRNSNLGLARKVSESPKHARASLPGCVESDGSRWTIGRDEIGCRVFRSSGSDDKDIRSRGLVL